MIDPAIETADAAPDLSPHEAAIREVANRIAAGRALKAL